MSKEKEIEFCNENKCVIHLLKFIGILISLPIALIYEPILWIGRVFSWVMLKILNLFKIDDVKINDLSFFSKIIIKLKKAFNFIITNHDYSGNSLFIKYIEKTIIKITAFYSSIIIVFIYVPARWIIRLISKFFLYFLNFIKIDSSKEEINLFQRIIASLKTFFIFIVTPHPYNGPNKLIMSLETNIVGEKVNAQKNRNFIFFLVPALGSFLLFVIIPFLMGVVFSFTDWTGLNNGNEQWVGFSNYKTIFTDVYFIYSFVRTSIYSIMNVIVINVVAFSLALLVTQNLKLKNVYRAGFFMPNLIGGLVLGYIWQFVYSSVVPVIGDLIGSDSGIFSHSLIGSAATSSQSMGALILVVTWQYAGYIMMIYIAALQNVPQDLIEASKIDGASAWQRLKHITLPLVAQAFTISLFLTLVTSFKQYDTVYSLTGGGPSTLMPGWLAGLLNVPAYTSVNSLDLMAINIYDTAFSRYKMGVGQAKAIVFFLILMVVSVAQVTYTQKKEVEL